MITDDRNEQGRPVTWALALGTLLVSVAMLGAADYEERSTYRAGDLLKADEVKGPHHTVADAVETDGAMHFYRITSDYGEFEAYSDLVLKMRLGEIEALNQLSEVSKAEVFADSAIQSILRPAKAVAEFAEKPVETIKGIPDGVSRMFGRVKKGAKDLKDDYGDYKDERAAKKAGEAEEKPAGDKGDKKDKAVEGATKFANSALGVTGAYRKWARKLGVDPYTDNQVLRKALTEVARVDAAGSIGVKVVGVPKVPGVDYISDVNQLVWSKSPSELAALNEQQMLAMGLTEDEIEAFRKNPHFASPTRRTRLVAALASLEGVDGRDVVIEKAAEAQSAEEALFQTTTAVVLQWFHQEQTPLARLVPSRAIAAGITADNRMILALATDRLLWTETVAKAIDWYDVMAEQEGAERSELWALGKVSARFEEELEDRGWAVHTELTLE